MYTPNRMITYTKMGIHIYRRCQEYVKPVDGSPGFIRWLAMYKHDTGEAESFGSMLFPRE